MCREILTSSGPCVLRLLCVRALELRMLSRRGAACQPIMQAVVLMVSCACVQPAIHAPSPAFCGISSACKGPADLRRRLPAANLHAKARSRQRQTPSSAPRSLRRLQMVVDNAKWADGGSGGARFWNEDPVAEAMAGSWKVDWSQDDRVKPARKPSVIRQFSRQRTATSRACAFICVCVVKFVHVIKPRFASDGSTG